MSKNQISKWVITVTGENVLVSSMPLFDEDENNYLLEESKGSNRIVVIKKSEDLVFSSEEGARRRAIALLREKVLESRRMNEAYTKQLLAYVEKGEEALSLVDEALKR